ncbi:MAG: transporter, partial [Gammaproteobacteria bacterium]
GLRRDAFSAELLAKANTLEAVMRNVDSNLRESYTNYRTAYDIAKHYQTEVVPMLDTLAEQNTLRYNGMLIGTFELLADSRNQVRSIESSIDASANFLRAQLALDAALMGSPSDVKLSMGTQSPAAEAAAGH